MCSRSFTLAVLVLQACFSNCLYANPLFPAADPDAVVIGDQWWVYPSEPGSEDGLSVFSSYSSPDLRHWDKHSVLLDLKDVPWVATDGRRRHGAWAPSILVRGGTYYFYYAVGPQTNEKPSRIGVATGDRPDGPFKDIGKPLVNDGGHGFEAIDPMAFTDPKSGLTYLYAGGSAGATLRVWELGDDLISLKREVKVDTPPQFTEGSFMHERAGLYYLSYSHGSYNDSNYSVHYATSDSPVGPWKYQGCILSSDDNHKGPGHHSFVLNPATGEWFIFYHRWESTKAHGPFGGTRQVAVEKVIYRDDGTIEPIRMTDGDGVKSVISKR